MILYQSEAPAGVVHEMRWRGKIPRGVVILTGFDGEMDVRWQAAAEVRPVAGHLRKVEAGLALEDLTTAQLKALAKAKGVKTSGKKAGLVSRVRTALALGSK
jgi:hypothetical protein